MRWILLIILIIICPIIALGQARTAERIVEVPFSQLNTGNPPDSSVRVILNGTAGTSPCTSGSVRVFAIKLNGVWQCPRLTPGAGTGDVLGPGAATIGELAVYATTSGSNLGRTNTLTGVLSVASGIPSALPTSGTGSVILSNTATLNAPTLLTPVIASNAFAGAQHPHDSAQGGGQLNASNVFSTGTIPPARVISGVITNARCLRVSNVGQIEVAAADCGVGGGGAPGGVSGNLLYNESGSFGGLSNTAYNAVSGTLTFSQKLNGSDTLVSLRTTDTSPTGTFLRFRDAANTTNLFTVGVDGTVFASNAVTVKNISAPATPLAGNTVLYADTDKNLKAKDDAGQVTLTVRAIACSGTDKISSISSAGVVTCTADQTAPAGAGITSLNALVAADQTFADVDDTNVTLNWSSVTSTHTLTVAWAGTLAKARQHAATVYADQANTWTTGAQSFAAATSLIVPSAAGASPTTSGDVRYDTASNTLEVGVNSTNRTVAFTVGAQTFSDKTLDNSVVANLRDDRLTLQDNADATKTVNFELSGITAGTNRVVTVADAASVTVQPTTATTNQWLTHIDSAGVQQKAQPAFSNLSGSLAVTQGSTGQTAVAQGDLLYGDAANSWARLPKSTTATRYLANTGTSNNPQWDQVNLANGVTGILPAANGGTGNGFFAVTGPATSTKTFTFPNTSATVLTDAAVVTASQGGTGNTFFAVSGPASTVKTFTFPNASATVLTDNTAVTIAQGGTGQITQTAAFNALDPLTTKGDLITHDGTNSVRLAAGTNGFALFADSTQTAGVRWGAVTATAGGSPTQIQYNSGGSLAGISGATTDGTITTFSAGNIIIGSAASITPALGKLYVDSDDNKLYFGIDGSTVGEIFVSGLSVVNLASANVTGVLPVANGGTGFSDTTFSGNTHKLVTTTGTLTSGRCVEIDASGNFIQASAACSTGGSGANTALSNLASVAINTTLASNSDNVDDLGTSSLAWRNLYLGTSIELGHASDTTLTRSAAGVMAVEGVTVSRTIASGTASLGTSAIASGACATAVTVTATGTATTDVVGWGFNSDPTSTTGYTATANGMLTIIAYPATNQVGFRVCNNTASSITPGAITLNWKVVR